MPEEQRLDQLITHFHAETERVEQAQVEGQCVAWVRQTPATLAQRRTDAALRLKALFSIHVSQLNPASRLDWRVFKESFERDATSLALGSIYVNPRYHLVDPPGGNFVDPPRTRADYEERLAWLRGVPLALKDAESTLRQGVSLGLADSRANVTNAIAQIRQVVPENPLDSPYMRLFKNLPSSISPDEGKQLVDEAATIYRKVIVPAYTVHLSFLEQTYLPGAQGRALLAGLPESHARYAVAMRRATGLQVESAQVYEDATEELQRLHGELDRLAREQGFAGTGQNTLWRRGRIRSARLLMLQQPRTNSMRRRNASSHCCRDCSVPCRG